MLAGRNWSGTNEEQEKLRKRSLLAGRQEQFYRVLMGHVTKQTVPLERDAMLDGLAEGSAARLRLQSCSTVCRDEMATATATATANIARNETNWTNAWDSTSSRLAVEIGEMTRLDRLNQSLLLGASLVGNLSGRLSGGLWLPPVDGDDV
ncbi:unnamed protein product, partial [Protopolystoma xenopodis]